MSSLANCYSIPGIDEMQHALNQAQRIPVLGLIPSTVKALLSVIELVVGLAGFILLSFVRKFSEPRDCDCESDFYLRVCHLQETSIAMFLFGTANFFYALGNLCTLGILSHLYMPLNDRCVCSVCDPNHCHRFY